MTVENRLASQAATQARSSTRRVERISTSKKSAINSADVIWTAVLQRQRCASIRTTLAKRVRAAGQPALARVRRAVVGGPVGGVTQRISHASVDRLGGILGARCYEWRGSTRCAG